MGKYKISDNEDGSVILTPNEENREESADSEDS